MTSTRILDENTNKPGTPKSYWDADSSDQIEGFAADISYDIGQTVEFKINVNGNAVDPLPYRIEIFRLGYYGGDGATLVATINNADGTVQSDPITDSRGLVDAGNWTVSDTWAIPTNTVSGVYLARLQRLDGNGNPIDGATNQIPFIVRDDTPDSGVKSDIIFQTSDTTWHAYNGWGGNNGQVAGNFYGDPSGTISHDPVADPGLGAQNRAYAVSYNRPFLTRDGGGAASGAQDYLFGADYAAIYWLEKNGYDVSYISGVDTDRLGADYLIGHKAYISVGHDEYWSGDQRANVEAARDAGVNLLFWSGNEVYWKTRYEPSIDGSSTPYRTLVSYKETWANGNPGAGSQDYANIDPSNDWTGTWRDLRFVDSVDGNGVHTAVGAEPENSLTGQLFGPDGTGEFGGALDIPAPFAGLRVWRDTGVAPTGTLDIAQGLLGYEWDTSPEDKYRPPGLIKLSETTLPWSAILQDQGNVVAPGTATHNLTLYRAESGALVFGSGTVFWSWGLSDEHDTSPYGADIADPRLQQFTINLFADMGIQPAVADAILASQGLVRASASTDTTPATTTVAIQGGLTSVEEGHLVTIMGMATDDDGNLLTDDGMVAAVEVSTDGGTTWRVASGNSNWTYTWTANAPGTHTILARAVDDSVNLQSSGISSTLLDVTASPASRLFTDDDPVLAGAQQFTEGTELELGVKFFSSSNGFITDVLFYKSPLEAETQHEGHLWSADGTLLATFTFENETASGWQTVLLDAPIAMTAATTYVASYHSFGDYYASNGYFNTADHISGSLTAPSTINAGGNGVYSVGGAAFPDQSFQGSNYWIDVVFTLFTGTNEAPIIVGGDTAAASIAENVTIVAMIEATDPNAGQTPVFSIVLPDGLNGAGADGALFAINAAGELSFVAPPDFEAPLDSNGDNVYQVTVRASDSFDPDNLFDEQVVTVTVSDQAEAAGAGFDGHLLQVDYVFGTVPGVPTAELAGSSKTVTASAAPDTLDVPNIPDPDIGNGPFGLATVDFGVTSIRVEFPLDETAFPGSTVNFATPDAHPYNGVLITDTTNSLPTILNVTLTDQAGFTIPLSVANITFTADSIFVNVNDLSGLPTLPPQNSRSTDIDLDTPGRQASFFTLDVDFNDAPEITSDGGGSNATIGVNENSTLVTTLVATDADNVPTPAQTLTFMILNGEDAAFFEILNGNELHFITAPDAESSAPEGATPGYQIRVQVSDGVGGSDTQLITVNVNDVDEFDPVIQNEPVSATVAESITAGAVIATVAATEADLTGTVSYAITGGNPGAPSDPLFEIDSVTGEISLVAGKSLDAETATNYSLEITASESDGAGTDVTTVAITVTDGNDTAPVIATSATQTVAENTIFVAALTATDADTVGTIPPTFSITGGIDQALFDIVGGNLVFLAAPDFETDPHSYQVEVTANDGANNSAPLLITVTLADENDTAPVITTSATQTVAENTTLVALLTSTDADTVGTNPATFSISGGADAALFDIVGGNLVFAAAPDFETDPHSYQVQVTANDDTNTTDKLISVTLTDVNEAPTGFVAQNVQTLPENTAVQTVVADLVLTDPDSNPAFNAYTYAVSDTRFDVVGGQLVLKAGQAVDFETEPSIGVTVTATNTDNPVHQITTAPITVTVTDVNEAPTGFVAQNVQTLPENTAVQTVVADLVLTDPDSNPAFNAYTYAVSDTRFDVVGGQLVLKAGQAVDFETEPSIGVTVTATNTDNPVHQITTAPITVTVTDVNEAPTGFVAQNVQTLPENTAVQTVVADLVLTDPDSNPAFNAYTYAVSDTRFDVVGGQLVLKAGQAVDFETEPSIGVTVTATNTDNPVHQITTAPITVTVIDVNEAPPPVPNSAPTDISLAGNSAPEFRSNGTVVGTLSTADPDSGDTATYALLVDAGGRFAIVGDQIVVADGILLDFEQAASHGVTVRSTDSGGLTLDEAFTISIIDVNPETVKGNAAANTIFGGELGDVLRGLGGNDTLRGNDGNDTIDGGAGNDNMNGGAGNDIYVIDGLGDVLIDASGIDMVRSFISKALPVGFENLALYGASVNGVGNAVANVIIGNANNNVLSGLAGNDTINGGAGNDFLVGGLGRDTMIGGLGADRFDFNTFTESPRGVNRDIISDFSRAQHDRIDLSTIDADTSANPGNDAFKFIGAQAFHGGGGEVRFAGGFVQADVNGDKIADLEIRVVGVTSLLGTDFFL